jgi:hypothetical protein
MTDGTSIEVDVVLGEAPIWTSFPTSPRSHSRRSLRGDGTTEPPPECELRFPRKEVIQPQLPLRLPCYDFTPIIDPTFDGSLPCGLGHRLRVLPTFVV